MHDLRNDDIGCARWLLIDKIFSLKWGAPASAYRCPSRACGISPGRVVDPRDESGGGLQGDRARIFDSRDTAATALIEPGYQPCLIEEVAAPGALVKGMNGENILPVP